MKEPDVESWRIGAISPMDGRYHRETRAFSGLFGEDALIKNRLLVESRYLIALSNAGVMRRVSMRERAFINGLAKPSQDEIHLVKMIETEGARGIGPTKHDSKAVEYYIRDRLKGTTLRDCEGFVHFCLTSDDVNNIAYSLMLRKCLEEIILPELYMIDDALDAFAEKNASLPMLARTHGQPASPTTLGKEFRVFEARLKRQIGQLERRDLLVKMNGATGNYNAQCAACPNVDWIKFTAGVVGSFNSPKNKIRVTPNNFTTQIESHDSYAEVFDNIRRINNIIIGLDQDAWRYISDGWINLHAASGEIGSSTMPHKINPIDFENSEGSLGYANAQLEFFSRKLTVSRLQRDLSDSTVERSFGEALARCLVGYKSVLGGLGKIRVNREKILADLNMHPEILAEAYQVILKREGVDRPYELLSEFTKGNDVTIGELHRFVSTLKVPGSVKKELLRLTPENYTGIARRISRTKP